MSYRGPLYARVFLSNKNVKSSQVKVEKKIINIKNSNPLPIKHERISLLPLFVMSIAC